MAVHRKKGEKIMADVNVQRRPDDSGRSLQRSQSGGLFGRRWPSLWRRPEDEFITNPFTMLRRFSEEMDRMFSSAWDDREFGGRELGSWTPAVEARQRDRNLVVHAALPGLHTHAREGE